MALKDTRVDATLIAVVLPAMYALLDEVLTEVGHQALPRALLTKCRAVLPSKYPNAFGYKEATNA